MPRPRFHQLPTVRRELILRAAGEEFSAHGYDGASLNRVLELMRAIPWYVGLWRSLYYPPADPRAGEIVAEKLERVTAVRRALIRRGQELGRVRDDLPEDLLLTALFGLRTALDRWFLERWDSLEPRRREALSRQAFAMVRRLLEPAES